MKIVAGLGIAAVLLVVLTKGDPKSSGTPRMQRNTGHSRIVNGVEATPNEFPHLVALTIDSLTFCGGSLISDEWVLTAAQCCDRAKGISVKAGAHDRTASEASQQVGHSSEIIVHENFNTTYIQNDVCLVRLQEPLDISTPEVSPIDLATEDPVYGTMVTVAGWGKKSQSGLFLSDVVRKATDPVLRNAECADYYSHDYITDQIICIDTSNGDSGTCNGDSGGPLMWEDSNGTVLVGVSSFVSSSGCESGDPDGFARITFFRDWIREKTGI